MIGMRIASRMKIEWEIATKYLLSDALWCA